MDNTNNIELKEKIRQGWEISAAGYNDVIQDDFEPSRKNAWLNTILEQAPDKECLKILDVGTGPGFFATILSEAGHDVTGIDISPKMINEAKRNAKAHGVNPVFFVMDNQHPEFAENTFDIIVSRNVVWSLTEPETAYRNWHKILTPGGKVLVFDGDHLKDLREPEKYPKYSHDEFSEEYKKVYGHEPKCSFTKENYEQARGWRTELPLANKKRPEWDIGICKGIGYVNVSSQNVNHKVFPNEKERILHDRHPMFLLSAEK